MFGSTNHFFTQPTEVIKKKYTDVYELLRLKGYSLSAIAIYLRAYDYFTENPQDLDGATLVKDLCDIPDLDLDAMQHDFHYLVYNAASGFVSKFKADWIYAKGQEQKGKGLYSAYSRFIGLTIIGIVFVPYARIKRGKMSNYQRQQLTKDYQILTKTT